MEAITLAINLAITTTTQQPQIKAIKILTTDAHLPKLCMNRSHRDLSTRLSMLYQTLADLVNRPSPPLSSISWAPISKGLHPIRRLKAIAATCARQLPIFPPTPPTKAFLRSAMCKEAISQWQDRWRAAPKRQPSYLALSSPPDGKPAPFVQGLTNLPQPIFTTGIRLLTGHAFTGEYNARHRPRSNDPHHCQCGEALQTAHHIITSCPTYAVARRHTLHPLSASLSLSTIFGTKEGGAALGAFLAETQACLRPRRRDPPPEDYG